MSAKRICRTCGKGEIVSTVGVHRYVESGLSTVVLEGVETRSCPSCGARSVVLPHVTQLHREIALSIVHKPARLSGEEVRYLRKYLGWSGADFARHIGVESSTVSNWETGKVAIGGQSDRALRLMAVHGTPVEDYSLDELSKIEDTDKPELDIRLRPKGKGWALDSAATG